MLVASRPRTQLCSALLRRQFGIMASSIPLADRADCLRAHFDAAGVDAYFIPSEDAHNSEYVRPVDERRAFVSGFNGSAGTAIVTRDAAYLWTDGRYFLQAESQLPANWTLMRMGEPGVPSITNFLATELPSDQRIGLCPRYSSINKLQSLQAARAKCGGPEPVLVSNDLVDAAWTDKPAAEAPPIWVHSTTYAGQPAEDKLAKIRTACQENGADGTVLTALDDIAWTLNLRGADIDCNPLFMSFLLVDQEGGTLFVNPSQVGADVQAHLQGAGIATKPYEDAYDAVSDAAVAGKKMLVDENSCSVAIVNALGSAAVMGKSPVVLPRAIKNDVELSNMWEAHLKDAVALCRYYAWLEKAVVHEGQEPTEVEAAAKLLEFRQQVAGFITPSFPTISSVGPNAAVIHYHAEEDKCSKLHRDCAYLCDSGGQYPEGTTDVTRTMWLGESPPPERLRRCFTRVLQGHIAMATAKFPVGTAGDKIDVMARAPLWRDGLDYRHGTGHGVGAFLCVHEGPQGVSFRPGAAAVPLQPGMSITNEPGYYEDGQFGIRIEDMHVVAKRENGYLGFDNYTFVPIQMKLVDRSLLGPEEVQYLKDYAARIHELVLPRVRETGDEDAVQWVLRETEV